MNSCRKLATILSLAVISIVAATNGYANDRVALLIGNSDYPESGLFGDLDNPAKDVFLVANALKKAGFQVILVQDADRTTMRMKLMEFEEHIKPGGTAVFYYAGHGIQFEGENYLLGTNARFEKQYELGEEAIKANTVLSAIANKRPKTALMFLDCCRESPPQTWLETKTRGMKTRGLGEMHHPDVVISFAAAPDKPAMDGDSGNSPYATALSKEIVKEQELGRVLKAVANDVYEETRHKQRPWWNGSLLHDFYFVKEGQILEDDVDVPSFASDSSALSKTGNADWTLVGDGKISASSYTNKIGSENNYSSEDKNEPEKEQPEMNEAKEEEKPVEPMVLPASGYYSNEEVFQNGPYAAYSDYTRRQILKNAQGKLPGAGYADGQMGGNTQTALISFQKQNSLAVTGRFDSATVTALGLGGITEQTYTQQNYPKKTYTPTTTQKTYTQNQSNQSSGNNTTRGASNNNHSNQSNQSNQANNGSNNNLQDKFNSKFTPPGNLAPLPLPFPNRTNQNNSNNSNNNSNSSRSGYQNRNKKIRPGKPRLGF